MAKYLILIYGDEQQWDAMTERDRQELERAHEEFRAAAGTGLLGGYELESPSTSTTLRADPGGLGGSAGRPTTTDGPFLETKETLGGYYVLEAPDLDAAIALAGMLPEVSAGHSGVEIRPVREAS